MSPGDRVLLSVEVWGRQDLLDNGLADKDPADGRPVFNWGSNRGGTFSEARIASEWRNGVADDRVVLFTAPDAPGSLMVETTLDEALDCFSVRDGETELDREARCTARFEIIVRRGAAISPLSTTAPVNPVGTIPETITDTDGVAYAVFTPVDGGSFAGDGYSISASAGAVADGEFIGVAVVESGDASNVGKTWHRYTLRGSTYRVMVVDSAGSTVSDYVLSEPAAACLPLPAELRSNISEIVVASTDHDGEMTVLSTTVKITASGAVVCGKLSSLPANLAVGKIGSPPAVEEMLPEDGSDEPLPDTGGTSPTLPLAILLTLFGSLAVIASSLAVMRPRRPARR